MEKRKIIIMMVLLVGLLVGNAFAGIEGKVSLSLVDGTKINGWLTDESIEFEASFGKVTIRRDQISSLTRLDGLQGNNYKLSLKDGSVLMGRVTGNNLNIVSKLGQLQVRPDDISCLSAGDECGDNNPVKETTAPKEGKKDKAWWEKK